MHMQFLSIAHGGSDSASNMSGLHKGIHHMDPFTSLFYPHTLTDKTENQATLREHHQDAEDIHPIISVKTNQLFVKRIQHKVALQFTIHIVIRFFTLHTT